ncbi:TPR domain family protein [Reticulomyxa filosa]|uniref:TPR domain family protein n=1 Tax=Reticulomyxa filosa TaxID=46433 RepID=X6PB11_RETFI|nr:TPR domain family protein [Reticulomyxa filosa]|eukprot:ETO34827.1 TPR domain family protein [Reticulomyxa filosa]
MSSVNVFVTTDSKKYNFRLTLLTTAHLEQQIVEYSRSGQQEKNVLVKITDRNGHTISTDQHLQNAVEDEQLHLVAYFHPENVSEEHVMAEKTEKRISYKVKYPLVLLTGAVKYQTRSYLESVKQDLYLLQTLFQSKFGYQVFNTYNPQKSNTESLTLNGLNNFISRHSLNLANDMNDKISYDGLIFVWCGYGCFEGSRGILVTSDNKIKDFHDVQEEFVTKTMCLMEKPKVFINIIYNEQEKSNQMTQKRLWYNYNEDIFTVFANLGKAAIAKKASSFTEIFCQIFENKTNQSFECIIKQVTKIILDQVLEREIVQSASTNYSNIYFISRMAHQQHHGYDGVNETKDEIPLANNIPETLDLREHWNYNWRRSNIEAAKKVEQMINDKDQGLVIVNKVAQWQDIIKKKPTKIKADPCSLVMLAKTNKIVKRQFGEYWLYVIKSKLIILDGVHVDGNIYAINCQIQYKENVKITTQLFATKDTIIDRKLKQLISPILWNTNIHHNIPVKLQDLEEKEEQCSETKLFDERILHLQKHLQISTDTFGLEHPCVAISYNLMGIAYEDAKQYGKAIEYYEKALKIILDTFGINHSFIVQLCQNLELVYSKNGQYEKSVECCAMLLKIRQKVAGKPIKDVADLYWNLGLTCEGRQENKRASTYFEEAWKAYTVLLGEWNKETLNARRLARESYGQD